MQTQCDEEENKEMRERFTCEICKFRTTSEIVMKKHTKINHGEKSNRILKRKICGICQMKFNKENTFMMHMKTVHKDQSQN